MLRLGLIVGVALSLAGCERGAEAEALLQGYQQRLAAALDVTPPSPTSPANIAAFPDEDARLFDIPETREGILDIYALRECQIAALVANRNNQLGRVAAPSQRWLYELRLWRRLHACHQSEVAERLDEDDRQRLERLTRIKTEQMPMASWNALFASEEWTGTFSRASGPLAPDALGRPEEALAALAYLRTMTAHQLDPDWQPDSATLEHNLKALREAPFSAQVVRSLQLVDLRLRETNRMMSRAMAEASCPMTDDAQAMELSRYTDDELRPYLKNLTRVADAWLSAVDALLDAQRVSREAIEAYRRDWLSLDHPRAPWQRFLDARHTHRQHWAQLMRHCNNDEET
ncbi:DUF3080 family protein [Halomonas sp. YLGW01]|uniref:DUF3080 family protein n=1 Tax=Halomonas sp. YLGW01 TaxID=2773308 RepID=UPI00177C7A1B|nr:DUF3080 family protein [Halomonas sp. YLGW01]